ncbi:MAG TPA: rhomboid family intramembrane serine protease [Ideonella sp.]|uniref:rhomboid family intramembrane serine protease n=1 Tax=Ideonella sp. TaxID=1929293 RepID=UPI002B742F4D|nr:rhomboid family intramembrane serine protease [Ideonella sp.]HSI49410.1 rhomboid family intramembrane serine protease [Ideonella sp.]
MPPIPPITKALMLICTAMFCLDALLRSFIGPVLPLWFALWPLGTEHFMPWQPFTFVFVHTDVLGLFFNMLALWMFGAELERLWGYRRYVQFLLAATVTAAICYLLLSLAVSAFAPAMGSAPMLYATLLASAMLFPDRTIMPLFPPIPMKQRTFVMVFGAIVLFSGLGTRTVAPFAYLGGMAGAWLIIRYWRGQAPFPPKRRR